MEKCFREKSVKFELVDYMNRIGEFIIREYSIKHSVVIEKRYPQRINSGGSLIIRRQKSAGITLLLFMVMNKMVGCLCPYLSKMMAGRKNKVGRKIISKMFY